MICVIIERHIAETLEDAYEQRARAVLRQAFDAPGFISGETLRDANDYNHRVILSHWESIPDWQHWHMSTERQAIMAEILPMLDQDEKITVLERP